MSVFCLLAGCSSLTTISDKSIKPTEPASLVQECPKVPEFEGRTMGDLLKYTNDLVGLYDDCADSKKKLVESTKI